jgi:gamma-glutamyltranspeptidase/glutathione hydrolase
MTKLIPAWLAAAALLAACGSPAVKEAGPFLDPPEAPSGYTEKPGWATAHHAVAAANPLAAEAGEQVLRDGGSAVDAAVAVQMVLGLVEPQSSGIGGGAFLLHYDGREVQAFDGRETAPAAATGQLFLRPDGKPMSFTDAVVGGRSVGVPGTVAMLEMAHRQHGKLPWSRLFEPAILLAEAGFRVSPRLHGLIAGDRFLKNDPVAAAYFFDTDGQPRAVGSVLRNPDYAAVLRRIATQGSAALSHGEVAQAIVTKVRGHATNPGELALSDLAGYQPKQRTPICFDHRGGRKVFRICGFPPPSSGAIAIGQVLGMLAGTNAATFTPVAGISATPGGMSLAPAPEWLHLYSEASRLAFADRAAYVGDPDFVTAPAGDWMSLLAPRYLAGRARLIGSRSMQTAPAGRPEGAVTAFAPMPAQPEHGTSHMSIVDGNGNALAMTTTIESQFGSRQMVNTTGLPGGFLLNNELTDFSFTPTEAGRPVANRVQPGKRPRSSMAPTLAFDKDTGNLVLTTGSSGGAMIIHFTAKTLYGVLNLGLNAQQAIDLPNFGTLEGRLLLEEKRFAPATLEALRRRGDTVVERPLTSGLQAIQSVPNGWFGAADPRREGVVAGE